MNIEKQLLMYESIINSPNFAHIATIDLHGKPHTTPVWIDFDQENKVFYFTTSENSIKDKSLQNDPNIAFSMFDCNNPYHYIMVRGTVIKREIDQNATFSNHLTAKYSYGKRHKYLYANSMVIVKYTIQPTKISGWRKESASKFNSWMQGENY